LGVDAGAVLNDLKMEMGSGGVAGTAHSADSVAPVHSLSLGHTDAGQMAIQRHISVAVVYHDAVAVAAVPSGKGDGAAVGGVHCGALVRGYIQAGVSLLLAGYGMDAQSEAAGYIYVGSHGPQEAAGGV